MNSVLCTMIYRNPIPSTVTPFSPFATWWTIRFLHFLPVLISTSIITFSFYVDITFQSSMLCNQKLKRWVIKSLCSSIVWGTARLLCGAATMLVFASAVHEGSKFSAFLWLSVGPHHLVHCPLIEVPWMTGSFEHLFICFLTISRWLFLCIWMCISVCSCAWQTEEH